MIACNFIEVVTLDVCINSHAFSSRASSSLCNSVVLVCHFTRRVGPKEVRGVMDFRQCAERVTGDAEHGDEEESICCAA